MTLWMSSGVGVNETTLGPSEPCTPIPAYNPTFIILLQVCVTVVSVLSILGAGLIILTFIAYKTLRTRARQILVQLSIADLTVAATHLIGVNVNLPKYAGLICSKIAEDDMNITSDTFCKVQGGITIYFTIGSYLWTIAVAIYLLTVIVFESQRVGKWLMYLFYPLCWGFPAFIIMVFVIKQAFGFHANVDTGWCLLQNLHYNSTTSFTVSEVFSQVFVYLTYLTLLILYLWIRCSIRFKIRRVSNKLSISYKLRLKTKNADLKLTFIPLIFIILRVSGTILGIAYVYLKKETWASFRETRINAALVLLSAIGSSAQGLMNALLFCVFTSVVRKKLTDTIKTAVSRCFRCYRKRLDSYLLEPSTNYSETANGALENTTDDIIWKEKAPVDFSNPRNSVTTQLLGDGLESSKYHSVSVGKRVTVGTE